MRFDTFKRHDFFQSFASIGRVDLVYKPLPMACDEVLDGSGIEARGTG